MATYKTDRELIEEAQRTWRLEWDSPHEAYQYLKIKQLEDALGTALELIDESVGGSPEDCHCEYCAFVRSARLLFITKREAEDG